RARLGGRPTRTENQPGGDEPIWQAPAEPTLRGVAKLGPPIVARGQGRARTSREARTRTGLRQVWVDTSWACPRTQHAGPRKQLSGAASTGHQASGGKT